MRPMAPLQASIASLSSVLPDDACPTTAKLRMFAEGCVAITPRMRRKWLVCKFHERKVAIDGNVHRWSFGVLGAAGCALWPLPSRFSRCGVLCILVAAVRHQFTNYDTLLLQGIERHEARALVSSAVERKLAEWSAGRA